MKLDVTSVMHGNSIDEVLIRRNAFHLLRPTSYTCCFQRRLPNFIARRYFTHLSQLEGRRLRELLRGRLGVALGVAGTLPVPAQQFLRPEQPGNSFIIRNFSFPDPFQRCGQ